MRRRESLGWALRELMDAIETRAITIREQLRLFPAPPVEVQPDVDVELSTMIEIAHFR
jgi:hypothetical protein